MRDSPTDGVMQGKRKNSNPQEVFSVHTVFAKCVVPKNGELYWESIVIYRGNCA